MADIPKPRTRATIMADFERMKNRQAEYLAEKKFTEASQVLQDMRGLEQELEALTNTKPHVQK